MTRVIAGTAGGRRLAVPPGNGTRPTSDRAREGLFSTWQALARARWTAPASSTCTPAPEPSAWRRSPAAPRTPCSSRPTPARPAPSGRTSRRSACPAPRSGRAKRHRSSTAAAPGDPVRPGLPRPAVRRHRRRSSGDPAHTPRRGAGSRTTRSSPWNAAPEAAEFRWPDGFEALRSRRYGEGTFWYGRAASTCDDSAIAP